MGVCFNITGWNFLRLKNYCANFESWWRGETPSNQPIWGCVETSGMYRIRLLYPNFDDHHFSDEICHKDFQTSPYQDPFFWWFKRVKNMILFTGLFWEVKRVSLQLHVLSMIFVRHPSEPGAFKDGFADFCCLPILRSPFWDQVFFMMEIVGVHTLSMTLVA